MWMSVILFVAFGVAALARGRWSGPWWILLVGCVLAYPVTQVLLERTNESGVLAWAFRGAVGMLVSTALSPVFHLLHDAKKPESTERPGAG